MAAPVGPCHAGKIESWGRGTPKRKVVKRARKTARKPKAVVPAHRQALEAALASLAHDIRTPLTGILALSDLLIACDLPERERGWARAIRSAADHLAQQTSLVLDAVKADRGGLALRKDVFSPVELAEAIAASLSARAPRGAAWPPRWTLRAVSPRRRSAIRCGSGPHSKTSSTMR
jgi:signal transduction histidine kinase